MTAAAEAGAELRAGGGGAADLRAEVDAITWYHTQELAPGIVTPGMFDLRPHVAKYGLPEDLSGLRVLDVGTFEGFWAFELERRGAAVTALDIDRLSQLDWPRHLRPEAESRRGEGFALAKRAFGSAVERVGSTVYEATPEKLGGRFDLVFCGSVMIHVRDPVLAFERLADLCSGRLIFADEYSRRLDWLRVVEGAEFTGNSAWMTWWRPAPRTWVSMLRCAGFEDVEIRRRFKLPFRDGRGRIPHVLIEAEGPAA